MKKLIASLLAMAMVVSILGPAVAQATITTGLTRGLGGGDSPIVKVKWEMHAPYASLLGTDDSEDPGAQFYPPGVWDASMNYSVCAIVTDPDGVANIDGVYVDIYYPEGIAFHPEDGDHPDVVGGGDGSPDDYGLSGCGAFIEENELLRLPKMDGYNLFCSTIRYYNSNLPTFFDTYDYDEICGATGELMKEEAYVYCDDKTLTWEDPAGTYRVEVFALDTTGNFSYTSTPDYNEFEYLPLVGYEVDFDQINYGQVMLNSHKIISGDLTWDDGTGPNPASVRNIGNTRLYMWVEQDDMGLGSTGIDWNVQYDARVGNEELDWVVYDPEDVVKLEDILDLSEMEEMDFSIKIFKFPSTETGYSGDLELSASRADFRACYN